MRHEQGGTRYEYIAVYVDDLAIAAKDPQACNKPSRKSTISSSKVFDRILTYGTLLDVLWQMYHAWITYGTVRRIA